MTNSFAITERAPKRADYDDKQYLDKDWQEDKLIADPETRIYIIADGITELNEIKGHGKAASNAAVQAMYDALKRRETIGPRDLRKAFTAANKAVRKETNGMGGTTLDVVVARYNYAFYGHIGDSRIYQISRAKIGWPKKIRQITEDDAPNNFIGSYDPKPTIGSLHLKQDDLIMLCTDGLYKYANEEELQKWLTSDLSPEVIAKKLAENTERQMIEKSNWGMQTDNYSIIIYRHKIPRIKRKSKTEEQKLDEQELEEQKVT